MNSKVTYRLLMLIPLAVSLGYLFVSPYLRGEDVIIGIPWSGHIQITILFVLAVNLFIFFKNTVKRNLVLNLICILPPLAVSYAWTLAGQWPGSYGGYAYFIHWLTKYPNFGPINLVVFAGMCSIILSSMLPAVYAFYMTGKRTNRAVVSIFMIIESICLSAVFVMLDFDLFRMAVNVSNPVLISGPLLRLAGGIAMYISSFTIVYKKKTNISIKEDGL